MKILLINNREAPQVNLQKFLENYGKVDVIHFQSISILSILKLYIKRPDLIVLSGSGEVPLNFSLELYRDELELIKTSPFPIIGICFGFEAIAVAYDEKLTKKEEKVSGVFEIKLRDELDTFKVWQSHNWYLEKSVNLEVLGRSINGLEVVKVPNKKIYGLQFHPEHLEPKNDGKLVFEMILSKIYKDWKNNL